MKKLIFTVALALSAVVASAQNTQNIGKTQPNVIDTIKARPTQTTTAIPAQQRENVQKVRQYLEDCHHFALATLDGDRPQVRPFGAVNVFEEHLYLITGARKDVAHQIAKHPVICISGVGSDGSWIRINAKLMVDSRFEAKESMLEANPDLRSMYNPTDNNMTVYRLTDAEATIYSDTGKTVIHF